jgi:hypothetical protein
MYTPTPENQTNSSSYIEFESSERKQLWGVLWERERFVEWSTWSQSSSLIKREQSATIGSNGKRTILTKLRFLWTL